MIAITKQSIKHLTAIVSSIALFLSFICFTLSQILLRPAVVVFSVALNIDGYFANYFRKYDSVHDGLRHMVTEAAMSTIQEGLKTYKISSHQLLVLKEITRPDGSTNRF